jgi:hypothetical protein
MKITQLTPTLSLGFAALTAGAWAQAPAPVAPPVATITARAPGELKFNFRGAPLETVLNYMSEAAGFIIVMETPVRGTVDMYSAQPVTKDEALQLLQIALSKNGYSAVTQGRTLVISSKDDAKKKNLPIRTGNNPEEIPMTAEMFIQIIPLRHLDATTAARDLGTMLPGSSAITANVDSNSLLVTDTNINLKQVVTLVNALDSSSDTVSTIKIFKLTNADPYEMATLLTNLYAAPAQGTAGGRGGQNSQTSGRGGFNGAFGGIPALAAALGGGGGTGGGRDRRERNHARHHRDGGAARFEFSPKTKGLRLHDGECERETGGDGSEKPLPEQHGAHDDEQPARRPHHARHAKRAAEYHAESPTRHQQRRRRRPRQLSDATVLHS